MILRIIVIFAAVFTLCPIHLYSQDAAPAEPSKTEQLPNPNDPVNSSEPSNAVESADSPASMDSAKSETGEKQNSNLQNENPNGDVNNGQQDQPQEERRSGRGSRRGGGQDRQNPDRSPAEQNPQFADKKIRFNISNQAWKDLIEWLADQAGLTLSMNSYPQGSFSYKDSENYFTPDEAIDLINGFLIVEKEFALIRKGKMLRVFDLGPGAQNGIPNDWVEVIFPEDLPNRGYYEVLRCQFDLKRTTPAEIQTEIERIISPVGSLSILPKSGTIQITDTGGNLRAIKKIIDKLDNPELANLKPVELKNLTAEEAIALVRNLVGISPDDQTLRMAADSSGKKVWISGRIDQIEKAASYLEKVDVSEPNDFGPLEVKFYPADNVDANVLRTICDTLLADRAASSKKYRMSVEPGTNTLVANVYADDHKLIEELLKQLKSESFRTEIIKLNKLSTSQAISAVEKFFGSTSNSSSSSGSSYGSSYGSSSYASNVNLSGPNRPPVVEADTVNKQLIVRATSSQISQIRKLLNDMGETSEENVTTRQPRASTSRTIAIPPSAAEFLADQIKSAWEKGHENELKIVTPSAMVPTLRANDNKPSESLPRQEIKLPPRNNPGVQPSSPRNQREREPQRINPTNTPVNDILRNDLNRSGNSNNDSAQDESVDELLNMLFEEQDDADIEFGNGSENGKAKSQKNSGVYLRTTYTRQIDDDNGFDSEDTDTDTVVPRPVRRELSEQQQESLRNRFAPAVDEEERIKRRRAAFELEDNQNDAVNQSVQDQPIIKQDKPARIEVPNLSQEEINYLLGVKSQKGSPIVMSIGPNGLMLMSDDTEALDALEDLIEAMSNEAMLSTPVFKPYEIKYASADEISNTIDRLMGSYSSSSSNNASAYDDAAGTMMFNVVSSLGVIQATGTVTTTPITRLNTLLVKANPVDQYTIEKKLIPLLDVPRSEDIPRESKVRMIP
ncbi:MAG: hypothetical protein ACRC2T_05080, partial [Thermoguttaceae bacterium]